MYGEITAVSEPTKEHTEPARGSVGVEVVVVLLLLLVIAVVTVCCLWRRGQYKVVGVLHAGVWVCHVFGIRASVWVCHVLVYVQA